MKTLLFPACIALLGAIALPPPASAKPKVTPLTTPESECVATGCVKGGRVTLDAGDKVGDHTHPRPVVVTVMEGELTLVDADGKTRRIGTHQAAIEPPGVRHHAENRGSAPVTFIFTTITDPNLPAFVPAETAEK